MKLVSSKVFRLSAVVGLSLAGALGCVAGAAEEESSVEEAREAQIDPVKHYLIYALTQNGIQIGKVLVTSIAGAGYDGQREYWYLNQNVSPSYPLTFTSGAAQWWTNPPPPMGTLSFVTERRPHWASAVPSGTMLLKTNPLTGERIGIDWQMTQSGGVWSGHINWWHSNTGNLFGENQTHTLQWGTPAGRGWYSFLTTPL